MKKRDEHPAALIGRRCAEMGLDLAAAQMVFQSLYFAAVLSQARNNRSEAARIAECRRETVWRAIKRQKSNPADDPTTED